jgi:hypothetical protein
MRVRGFWGHRGFIVVGYDGGQNGRDKESSVEQEQKPRERSFIRELVPDRWPTRAQWVLTIRITVAVVVAIAVVAPLGVVL